MLTRIYERNPSERELRKVVEALERDGIVVYPTDSLYAFGCSIRSPRAIERLRRLREKETGHFSLVFDGIARVAEYCRVDNRTFRILKRNLPGPFTFVLEASSRIPDKALGKRRTIGVRIPDNAVAQSIVGMLGCPLVSASVPVEEDETEYASDPELLDDRYGRDAALVVDGGPGGLVPTTVVDLSGDEPEILREGKGVLQ